MLIVVIMLKVIEQNNVLIVRNGCVRLVIPNTLTR